MQCPRCHSTMHATAMETAKVEECPQCGGIWFEHGELHHYLETDPDLRWLDIDFWKEKSDFKVTTELLSCPKCRRYYLIRLVDHTSATSVALCNNCRGIWIEADQLRAIIQALTHHADQMDSGEYLRESLHQMAEMIASAPNEPVSHWRDLKAVLRMLRYRIYSEHPKLVNMLVGAQKSLPI